MLDFKMKIDTSGIEELEQFATQKLVPVVKKHALIIQGEAAKNAPVDTGALKNSIIAEESEKTDKNWIISDGVVYGVHQELGTKRGVTAKHFLGNACEKQAEKFFNELKAVINA